MCHWEDTAPAEGRRVSGHFRQPPQHSPGPAHLPNIHSDASQQTHALLRPLASLTHTMARLDNSQLWEKPTKAPGNSILSSVIPLKRVLGRPHNAQLPSQRSVSPQGQEGLL